jgi:hypothetical protein
MAKLTNIMIEVHDRRSGARIRVRGFDIVMIRFGLFLLSWVTLATMVVHEAITIFRRMESAR